MVRGACTRTTGHVGVHNHHGETNDRGNETCVRMGATMGGNEVLCNGSRGAQAEVRWYGTTCTHVPERVYDRTRPPLFNRLQQRQGRVVVGVV